MGIKEVAAGAAWLDKEFPGWEREIDLGTLDLEHCQSCICGQSLRGLVGNNIESGYHAAIILGAKVSEDWVWNQDFVWALSWARDHGFAVDDRDVSDNHYRTAFDELDVHWSTLIKERFNTGNLSDMEVGDHD